MSDEHSFLAAIEAAPEDDAPWLIYADWLDEHGRDDLAEVIRVEIRRPEARARLVELQRKVGAEWVHRVFPFNAFILRGYPEHRQIEIIKLIRDATSCELAEAKRLAERLPATLRGRFTPSSVEAYRSTFVRLGADVEPVYLPPPARL